MLCCLYTSRYKSNPEKVSLFLFPKNEALKEKLIKSISRKNLVIGSPPVVGEKLGFREEFNLLLVRNNNSLLIKNDSELSSVNHVLKCRNFYNFHKHLHIKPLQKIIITLILIFFSPICKPYDEPFLKFLCISI